MHILGGLILSTVLLGQSGRDVLSQETDPIAKKLYEKRSEFHTAYRFFNRDPQKSKELFLSLPDFKELCVKYRKKYDFSKLDTANSLNYLANSIANLEVGMNEFEWKAKHFASEFEPRMPLIFDYLRDLPDREDLDVRAQIRSRQRYLEGFEVNLDLYATISGNVGALQNHSSKIANFQRSLKVLSASLNADIPFRTAPRNVAFSKEVNHFKKLAESTWAQAYPKDKVLGVYAIRDFKGTPDLKTVAPELQEPYLTLAVVVAKDEKSATVFRAYGLRNSETVFVDTKKPGFLVDSIERRLLAQ